MTKPAENLLGWLRDAQACRSILKKEGARSGPPALRHLAG